MIGRVALLVTFKKAKPKPQSLSRSHIRDLAAIEMKIVYLRILVISLTLSSLSCTSEKSEPSKLPSQNKRALQAQPSELKDTISQKHFDPN